MAPDDFYHIATADPYCQDPLFLQAVARDPQLALQVKEAKELTEQLETLFSQPDVDQAFAATVIKKAAKINKTRRIPAMLALAASFFVAAISLAIWQTTPEFSNDLSQHALAHTRHGTGFAGLVNEQPSISSINYRLKTLGAQFSDQMADVTWFNDCSFEGINSLHLVFNGQQGRINVFVVAKDPEFVVQTQFSNDHYQGIAQELESAYILIVGEHNESLQPFQQQLTDTLHWNI